MHQDLVLILIGQFLDDLLLILLLVHPNSVLVKYCLKLGEELLVLVQLMGVIGSVSCIPMMANNPCFLRSRSLQRSLFIRVL